MAANEYPPTKQDESFSEAQPRIDEPDVAAGEPDDAAAGATPTGVPHARPDDDSEGAEEELEGKGWTQGVHAVK